MVAPSSSGPSREPSPPRAGGLWLVPLLVLVAGWTGCALLVASAWRNQRAQDAADFARIVATAETALRQRFTTYTDALQAAAGFLRGSREMRRLEWAEFARTIDLQRRYPGIRGIGVVLPVNAAGLSPFLATIRADGMPDFQVHDPAGADAPAVSARAELGLITYVEPQLENQAALGVDVLGEPRRRAAALAARDQGTAQLTQPIVLVQDAAPTGSLLFVPVYRAGASPQDPAARRREFVAWVYAPIVMTELLGEALRSSGERVQVTVFDLTPGHRRTELFRSGSAASDARFELTTRVEVAGRTLLIGWNRGRTFLATPATALVWSGGLGALAVLLLAGLVATLQATGNRARRLAAELTQDMRETQRTLEAVMRLHQGVLDGTTHAIISTRPDGIINVFNTGAERMLGYSRAEMVGHATPLHWHEPEEVAARAAELAGLVSGPAPDGFEVFVALARRGRGDDREWTFRRKDGTRLPVHLSVTALRNEAGEITGFLGIAHDLTDRKRAEWALRETEERLARVLGHAECLVWEARGTLAPGGYTWRTTIIPSALSRRLQLESTASADALWYPPTCADRAEVERKLAEALAQDLAGYAHELRLTGPEPAVWLRESVAILREAQGGCWLVGVAIDVTEHKRLEHALRESERRVRSSLQEVTNLKTALDAHAIVAITDARGVITYANDAFCRISQRTSEELVGQTHRVVSSGYHSREFFRDLWTTITAGRIWRGEICNRAKDGSFYWVDATIVPFLGEDGRPVQYIAVRTDITDRKRLENNLAIARDQALEASRLKSEFLATMSHEIRTPMNAIIGMAGLLADTPLTAEQSDMLRIASVAAESLLAIINDILDFSRIESGKLRLNVRDFDLAAVVDETVSLLAPQAHEKEVEIIGEFFPAPDSLLVGDPGRVRQVLLNLIGNAVKFTDSGEVVVSAAVTLAAAQRTTVRIEVRDTGIGIPAEVRDRLFRPFVQADGSATRRFGGAGLGLAITRQLIEAMGGSLGFASEPGQGSTFWVELDLPRGGPLPPEARPVAVPAARALIVDDQATARTQLQRQLAQCGVASDTAVDGPTALARLREAVGRWDVVLVDWQMPGMSGLELAMQARADSRLAGLRSVLLAPIGVAMDAATAAAVGFSAVLTKPVSEVRLARCLASVLGAAAPEQPRAAATPRPPTAGAGLRVLVVEDNLANQRVATLLLEKLGHVPEVAPNGHQALNRLAHATFDAVLMDCQMPLLDGYETTRWIRSGKVAAVDRDVPVIALTAYVRPEDQARCEEAGMNDYLAKPLRLNQLSAALDRLARRGARSNPPAPPPAAGEPDPVLDPETVQTMRALPGLRGPSLLPELVTLYLDEEPVRLREIARLAAARHARRLAEEVHGFGGNAAAFGGVGVRRIALELEEAARVERWTDVDAQLSALNAACRRLRGALRQLGVAP